ncbi:MAG: 5'/3'-nucleotidase SurE [Candidatus Ranarchaeia archaeon]|jgi:5'-nucleotidase
MKKKILLTNDDGIDAPCLAALARSLQEIAEVIVMAPETQESGTGKAITFYTPVRKKSVQLNGVTTAYAVNGKPADVALIGLSKEHGFNPDLVVSGINSGANISTHSVMTSGTIAAGFEAVLHGCPAIAGSIQTSKDNWFDLSDPEKYYEPAIKIFTHIIKNVLLHGMPSGVNLLSINFPAKTTEQTSIIAVPLNQMHYLNKPYKRVDPRGNEYFWICGTEIAPIERNTDVDLIMNHQNITITPLSLITSPKEEIKSVNKYLLEWLPGKDNGVRDKDEA